MQAGSTQHDKKMKIGIVLSGGGVRGFAHLGLLQALDELGLHPYAISGVSAGAIVGALYAAGYKPGKILDLMKENSYFRWSNFLFNRDGFFSMQPLLEALQKLIPDDSFESLATRLYVTATDFSGNMALTFSTGRLWQPVIASCSVPVIFEPVQLEGSLLVDGGLLNNFPVEPLEGLCDTLIGSYVNNIQGRRGVVARVGKANMLERCFHMAIANTVYGKAGRCSLFIEPPLQEFGMFDRNKAELIYEIGYKAAVAHKEELLALLDKPVQRLVN